MLEYNVLRSVSSDHREQQVIQDENIKGADRIVVTSARNNQVLKIGRIFTLVQNHKILLVALLCEQRTFCDE